MFYYIIVHGRKILPRQTSYSSCNLSSLAVCCSDWWDWWNASHWRLKSTNRFTHATSHSVRRSWNWILNTVCNTICGLRILNAISLRLMDYNIIFHFPWSTLSSIAIVYFVVCKHRIWVEQIFWLIWSILIFTRSLGSFESVILWFLCFLITIRLFVFQMKKPFSILMLTSGSDICRLNSRRSDSFCRHSRLVLAIVRLIS